MVAWSTRHVPGAVNVRPNLYVLGCDPLRIRGQGQVFAVMGCGAIGSKFVTDADTAEHALGNLGVHVKDTAAYMRGSLCLFGFDSKAGEVVVAPDPFGAALVFVYKSKGFAAASGDIKSLICALQAMGIRARRSLKYAVEVALIGNAGLTPSPFEDVELLPNFSRLLFDSDGMRTEELTWVHDLFRVTNGNEAERREQIIAEILTNASAAIEADSSRKVAHLTGGFDSRMVLATILHHNAKSQFTWHTTGDPKLPDMLCAGTVASAEGLRMSRYPGYSQRKVPEGYESRIRASLDYSGGLVHIGPHEGCGHENALILAGGYGEIMRSFFDYRFDARNLSLGDQFERISWVSRKVTPGRTDPLISKEFAAELRHAFEKHVARAEFLGIREDARLDYFYLANRNRYWVGLLSFLWSRVAFRFDPLYSLSAAALSLATPRERRAQNFIGLDVMMTVRPQLLQYAYDREMAGPEYRRARLWPTLSKTGALRPPAWIDERIEPVERWSCDSSTFNLPKVTANDVAAARTARVTPAQWASRAMVTARVKELISCVDTSELHSIFNKSELDVLLASQPTTMGYIRLINLLHAYLLWYVHPMESLQAVKPEAMVGT